MSDKTVDDSGIAGAEAQKTTTSIRARGRRLQEIPHGDRIADSRPGFRPRRAVGPTLSLSWKLYEEEAGL